VIVPSAVAVCPVSAAPPTQIDAMSPGICHGSGVSDVTVAATSPSIRYSSPGGSVPSTPRNEQPQPHTLIGVFVGTPTCSSVLSAVPVATRVSAPAAVCGVAM
jgi:hypothetical protein